MADVNDNLNKSLNIFRQLFDTEDTNKINFELTANRHPKNYKNKSISYALNMRISDDGTCIQNDTSSKSIDEINLVLYKHYLHGDNIDYEIIWILPTNNELVLFVQDNTLNESIIDIWRYRETDKTCALFYNKGIPYNNGDFSGDFTYNSYNHLIIAFCEYPKDDNSQIMNPMMTINLGKFEEGHIDNNDYWINNDEDNLNDRELDIYKLPLQPEIDIPEVRNVFFGTERAFSGWYNIYIRFKINNVDYTSWHSIGTPILNNFYESKVLSKKQHGNAVGQDVIDIQNETRVETADKDGYSLAPLLESNFHNYNFNVESNNDIINKNIRLQLIFNNSNISYEYFQIGYVCITKSYTKYFISKDIKYENVIVDLNLNDYKEQQFNIDNFINYYNVKNIVNYKNKIYISNYKTSIIDTKNINIDNIRLNISEIENPYTINYPENLTEQIRQLDDYNIPYDINKLATNESVDYQHSWLMLGGTFPYPIETINGSSEHSMHKINLLLYIATVLPEKFNILKNIYKNNNNVKIIFNDIEYDNFNDLFISPKIIFQENFIKDDGTYYSFNELRNAIGTTLYYSDKYGIAIYENNISPNLNNIYIDIVYGLPQQITTVIHFYISKSVGESDKNKPLPEVLQGGSIYFNYNDSVLLSKKIYLRVYNGNTYTDTELLNMKELSTNNIDINVAQALQSLKSREFNTKNYVFTNSLKPGNIYDFYIHYIDKYGQVTDGVRIPCPKDEDVQHNKGYQYYANFGNGYEHACLLSVCVVAYIDVIVVKEDDYIIKDNEINLTSDNSRLLFGRQGNIFTTVPLGSDARDSIISYLYSLLDCDRSWKWKDISDELYNAPFDNDGKISKLNDFIYYNGYYKVPNNFNPDLLLKLKISGVSIPNDYIGYFISISKLENRNVINSLGSTSLFEQPYLNIDTPNINLIKLIPLDERIKSLLNSNSINNTHNTVPYLQDFIRIDGDIILYKYLNIKELNYGNDDSKHRNGKLTAFVYSEDFNELNQYSYKLTGYNINPNIYSVDNDLYKFTDIYYDEEEKISNISGDSIYSPTPILHYGKTSDIYSENNIAKVLTNYYGEFNLFGWVYGFEQFSFENEYYGLTVEKVDNSRTDTFVAAGDFISILKQKYFNRFESDLNKYQIHKNTYINEFNKTIYRSNVINDETRENNWRTFETEQYKNISENKGKITNLIALGDYFYIHTQHSLFRFDTDNTLKNNNNNVQLASIDIFDIDYREQFVTKLGTGGLQDKNMSLIGNFGYIYYNKDNKEIILINGQNFKLLSNNIYDLLQDVNPNSVTFINDIVNNRLFIKLNKENNNPIILSYNYKYNTFVSYHTLTWNNGLYYYGVNTKNDLYIYDDLSACHGIIKLKDIKDNDFGISEKLSYFDGTEFVKETYNKLYKLSIIFNKSYISLKYLEYIRYKLKLINNNPILDIEKFPYRKENEFYSGDELRIFNDIIDSNVLDISRWIANDYPRNTVEHFDKPYWDRDSWNFNYLRNNLNNGQTADNESRLYGNYFILAFGFNKKNNNVYRQQDKLIEFEDINIFVSSDKK